MKLRAVSEPRRKSTKSIRRPDSVSSVTVPDEVSAAVLPDDLHARIAVMAYELYQQRGGHDGHDWDDWFTAEQRVVINGKSGPAKSDLP